MRPVAHHSTRHLGNLWILVSTLILFVPKLASAQLIQIEDELRARIRLDFGNLTRLYAG
jgi:hypothetical protein